MVFLRVYFLVYLTNFDERKKDFINILLRRKFTIECELNEKSYFILCYVCLYACVCIYIILYCIVYDVRMD